MCVNENVKFKEMYQGQAARRKRTTRQGNRRRFDRFRRW